MISIPKLDLRSHHKYGFPLSEGPGGSSFIVVSRERRSKSPKEPEDPTEGNDEELVNNGIFGTI